MRRAIVVYATLLALALVGAYLSWTADPDTTKEEGIVVLEVDVEHIESVHYVSPELDVMLTAREDARGRYLWAKVIKQEARKPEPKPKPKPEPEPEAGDTGAETEETGEAGATGGAGETGEAAETGDAAGSTSDAASEPAPEPEPEPEPVIEAVITEFVVGLAGTELLADLAPLRAKRGLEDVGPEKLEEFGLAEAPAQLTIEIEGRDAATYEVGESGFGTAIMYLREPASGRVFVIDAKMLSSLAQADKRLPNRTLFAAKTTDIVTVEVSAEGGVAGFEHRNREDPERQFWAAAGSESGDETAQAWLQKFLRLRALGYVTDAEQPRELLPRFRVSVVDADGVRTEVEVLSGARQDGEQGWYARSEHTRGLVELNPSLAEDTAQDVGSVLE